MRIKKLILVVDYWKKHNRYAENLSALTGYAPKPGVSVTLKSASAQAFVATASHPRCDTPYGWDSAKGLF